MRSTRLSAASALLAALLVWALTPLAASAHCGHCVAKSAAAKPASAVAYACPMHPGVTSDHPGKCSQCGMFLEASPQERTVYACPMKECAEVKEKPGKCSKCGMNLEKRSEQVTYEYACPMKECAEVKGKPGKCSKCGMFFEARPKGGASAAGPQPGRSH